MRVVIDPTITRLLRDVCAGIRVFQSRDGVELSESQILERARNIVMGLVGNYRIEALDLAGDGRDYEGRDYEDRDGKGRDREPGSVTFTESASMMGPV